MVIFVAKYYPDPEVFNPGRFMGHYNKNAFIPYVTGYCDVLPFLTPSY
jgi:hypothetical protein